MPAHEEINSHAATSTGPGQLELALEKADGYVTVAVIGEVDLATAPGLAEALEESAQHEPAVIVLDLARCAFVDSSGLALIVQATRADGGSKLVLAGPRGQVQRALEISGIGEMLPVFENLADAVAGARAA